MQIEAYEAARQREDLRQIAGDVLEVVEVKHVPPAERGVIRLVGRLSVDPQLAYEYLTPRFRELGYTTLLQEGEGDQVAVLAMPGAIVAGESRLWLALVLFVLTVASTIFVGGQMPATLGAPPGFNLGIGLAFSASLLSILLAHELGHFLMARRLGVHVSYPFFIPMPFTFIGTMGAFIAMKEPPPDRRALLYIAIAGPVAGLVVAIPVLILGLLLSEVHPLSTIAQQGETVMMEGNSLLYAAVKTVVFGRFLPNGLEDVMLHPVAFAGWVGLLVTGLNLIPAGQLDGGHIFFALFGARAARMLTWGIAFVLVPLGFLWMGWFLWAALIVLFGQQRAPLLNELTPLDGRQRLVAALGLVLFIIVFTPSPINFVTLGS